jgi:hypothetical protein
MITEIENQCCSDPNTCQCENTGAQAVIDQLENARRRNNKNWMDLVRLAFEVAPERAREIMAQICAQDQQIMDIARKLAE